MQTLIAAGGSGVRVLEAALHLCAIGLGPEKLRLLIIDPDGSNGNMDRTSRLVDRYQRGHELFAANPGPGQHFFRTQLDLLGDAGKGVQVWSPVSGSDRLHDLLQVSLLESQQLPADLWQLFFTEGELHMDLKEGFRARPSVGAAAMSLVTRFAENPPWDRLLQALENELTQESGARVFLAGSVFGGTGAATLFPIARFLRQQLGETQRLRIAAAALTPYFTFSEAASGPDRPDVPEAARSEDFPTHTRGAVDFYHHLERHAGSPFDALFWIGAGNPRAVDFAPGGDRQRNPAHIVELISGLAALEFLTHPNVVQGSSYAGTDNGDSAASESSIDWDDLPLIRFSPAELRHAFLRFWLMGTVHLGFTGPLLKRPELDRQPRLVPWYWKRLASRGHRLSTDENRQGMEFLDDFFANHHFPWWQQIHQDDVRLANSIGLPNGDAIRLDRLTQLTWPDEGEATPEAVDRFYTDLASVPARKGGGTQGVDTYFSLLGHAADRFIAREYKDHDLED